MCPAYLFDKVPAKPSSVPLRAVSETANLQSETTVDQVPRLMVAAIVSPRPNLLGASPQIGDSKSVTTGSAQLFEHGSKT